MAELPESWGLQTKKRDDGRLDIVGTDDTGHEYRARTTDGPSVTDQDIADLRAADREAYPSREAGARAFVKSVVDGGKAREEAWLNDPNDEWVDAAMPVVQAGFGTQGLTFGSTRRYREAYSKVKW